MAKKDPPEEHYEGAPDPQPTLGDAQAPPDAAQPVSQPEGQTAVQVEDGGSNRPTSPVTMTPGAGQAAEPPLAFGATVTGNDPEASVANPSIEATSEPHLLRVTEEQYNETVRIARETGAAVEDGIEDRDGRRIGKLIVDGEDRSYEVY